jgi:hypothetical protein
MGVTIRSNRNGKGYLLDISYRGRRTFRAGGASMKKALTKKRDIEKQLKDGEFSFKDEIGPNLNRKDSYRTIF